MQISLAMIVKNEEETLERCLNSVKDFIDEFVIVDTGSTDKTIEIIKKFTDKVHHFTWIKDFAKARNYSWSLCTKEFIMWVDADDIVKEEDRKKIIELKKRDDFDMVLCDYVYFHDEYDKAVLTLKRHRIVRNIKEIHWDKRWRIHECLEYPLNLRVIDEGIKVHHYRTNAQVIADSSRNLDIFKTMIKEHPNEPRCQFYYAKELKYAGQFSDSIRMLEKFLANKDGWLGDKIDAHKSLAECYLSQINNLMNEQQIITVENKAINILKDGLKLNEGFAEFHCSIGQIYYNRGIRTRSFDDWQAAKNWFLFALQLEIPNVLNSVQPDYYNFVPHDRLCFVYSQLGNLEKADYHNDNALIYRPNEKRLLENRIFLKAAINERKLKDGNGKSLNLGAGNQRVEGYLSIDIYEAPFIDEVFDLDDIPYKDNTITAIYSAHALEHVCMIRGLRAIKEWFRVLKPGGNLILRIPDLELSCREYLNAKDELHKNWYRHTIFGYQKSLSGEPDEAQQHKFGYSKQDIKKILEETGFIMDYIENYVDHDTQSIALRAVKPCSNLKIGWISSTDLNAAQTRIRVLNINRWLRSLGYKSDIVNYPEIINQNYDVAIVGKGFDEHHYKNIRLLKQYGKTVYCDICEDILDYPWIKEILQMCDRVICCSHRLEEKIKPINSNTTVIEDSYET